MAARGFVAAANFAGNLADGKGLKAAAMGLAGDAMKIAGGGGGGGALSSVLKTGLKEGMKGNLFTL